MEEKRKDVGTPPPLTTYISESPAATEATTGGSRRRGGGQKRKVSSGISGGGSSNSTPPTTSSSKRQAREKVPPVPFTPIHNGPLTRARQQPNNSFAGPAVDVSSASVLKIEGELRGREAAAAKEEELIKEAAKEDWEALEAKIEAEYEGIRSRDDNVHVVPNHAGWFSWTKIHPLEEKILPSFFNGKSESRNPEVYMEIRNCIMKKFHANPSIQIEPKDLSEMSMGEMEARQEVMEFLEYWGLINYHPFLKTDMPGMSIEGDGHTAVKTESLVKTLFRFESDSSCMPVVPRKSIATPAAPPGFFPESAIAEELIKFEEPSVEYHCNSCSADCSRKRYHCQKQADFDLCTECFNNGKLGSDMSPSDFILMEPAEAGGASSGNWTDQETLLLLEALELFKENWSEIAEHVATKTKAQCILHFVQMPIEDTFLDSDEEIVGAGKENEDAVQINSESSAPKDAAENAESKCNADDNKTSSSPTENSKPEEVDVSNVCKVGENFVMKALTEAFEAVGPRPSPDERLSFAEAGNPVMTLAAFLLRLVEPNIVTASARSSLKSIHGNSSGDQFAARHCFCLEDSPDEKKSRNSERIVSEMAEEQTQKDEERNVEEQEEKFNSAVDGIHASHDEGNESIKDHAMDEEKHVVSASNAYVDESASTKEANVTRINEEPEPSNAKEQDDADFPKEPEPAISKKSDDSNMEVEVPPGFEKELEAGAKAAKPSKSAEVPNAKDLMPSLEDKIPVQSTTSNSVDESGAKEGAEPKDSRNREKEGLKSGNDLEDNKIKKAAVTAISAAAVKAKLLASQEEKQIQQLAALLIEKQLQKLEFKLAFFNDMENVVMRVREQLERSKQRLFHERAQIIAARLGMSGPRPMQPSSVNRAAMAFANAAPRPIIGMSTQRPPISRHAMAPTPASTSVSGTPMQSSGQDQLS